MNRVTDRKHQDGMAQEKTPYTTHLTSVWK